MALEAEARPFHVLAVDDSVLDRKLIERLLKTSSYHVTAVDSGRKALEFLGLQVEEEEEEEEEQASSPSYRQITVNLIITDYCMPGMTGYDLLKKIKESSVLRDIPVVIMSSENIPSRINRCLEEGAEEFLLKPVQLSDMKKLRPHILKGKSRDHEAADDDHYHQPTQPAELQQQQQQEQQRQGLNGSCNVDVATSNSNNNKKKRKAMDGGGLSPERPRPRHTSAYGLLTIV